MDITEFEKSCKHVTDGASWLDEVSPGWERKIDVSILDISDCTACVCGQVLDGGWFNDLVMKKPAQWLWDHGFLWPEEGDQWVALIKDRFDTGALSDL